MGGRIGNRITSQTGRHMGPRKQHSALEVISAHPTATAFTIAVYLPTGPVYVPLRVSRTVSAVT